MRETVADSCADEFRAVETADTLTLREDAGAAGTFIIPRSKHHYCRHPLGRLEQATSGAWPKATVRIEPTASGRYSHSANRARAHSACNSSLGDKVASSHCRNNVSQGVLCGRCICSRRYRHQSVLGCQHELLWYTVRRNTVFCPESWTSLHPTRDCLGACATILL